MKDLMEKYLLSGSNNELNEIDEYLSDLMEMVFKFIDSLDLDNLSEEQDELLEEILEMYEEEDQLSEKTKERVVRGGKKTRKLKCKSGYKAVGNKCVKMSSSEKHTRSKAAKKGARKSKSKKASTQRKRAKSMRKR